MSLSLEEGYFGICQADVVNAGCGMPWAAQVRGGVVLLVIVDLWESFF